MKNCDELDREIAEVFQMMESANREHQKQGLLIGSMLFVCWTATAAAFWFDAIKISFVFGCAAFYLSIWTICGTIDYFRSANILSFTLQSHKIQKQIIVTAFMKENK